jgi:quercetin dioxygenase-like cupin family protein
MEHWDLSTLDVEPHKPQVLHSTRGEARSITLHLPAGEQLQDHQVHERAYLFVASGRIEVVKDGESVPGGPGMLAHFEPKERHEVRATDDSRLVLLLSPWPGEGHPSRR